jgi:hypothetical protein
MMEALLITRVGEQEWTTGKPVRHLNLPPLRNAAPPKTFEF